MKRIFLLIVFFLPVIVLASTIEWDQPAYDTYGRPIPPEKMATVETHIYADDMEFAIALDGAKTWTGFLPQNPGETKAYTGRAELDYFLSAPSVPTLYYMPLPPPPPPPPVTGSGKMKVRLNPERNYICNETSAPLSFGAGYWKIQKYKTRPEIWIEITQ